MRFKSGVRVAKVRFTHQRNLSTVYLEITQRKERRIVETQVLGRGLWFTYPFSTSAPPAMPINYYLFFIQYWKEASRSAHPTNKK
jgi:hypothetical protein